MRAPDGQGATVFGHGFRTSPEIAGLANTIMVRTYDSNDAYFGHPSDMIPGILAAGEIVGSSGKDILTSIALAYEVYAAFARSAPYHLDSWLDQGVFMNVGTALGVGKLWGLSPDQLANATSLALTPNLPLGVSRWGTLSMMKGCATGFAVRNGIFAATLAQRGFTSSPEPFDGIFGLKSAIGDFDLRLPIGLDGRRVVDMVYIKPIPAENNTIGLIELVPEILAWAPVDQIDLIEIELATGLDVHLADESKYDPKTRESADHSLPFMLARALVDGELTLASYRQEALLDPGLRLLMRKIRVLGNEAMKARMRASRGAEAKPARIRVKAGNRLFEREIEGHSGHPERSPAERREMLDRKLDRCSQFAGVGEERREKIRSTWWSANTAPDIGVLIADTLADPVEASTKVSRGPLANSVR
ncbi:MAG: MmgE/PrpD family protein [Paracoccus sp. (in: a-proteobacteria)]